VFSGDTGIESGFWGGQDLVRAWASFMGEVLAHEPGRRLYWFLISKGYRTYLYLPLFFREFYPRCANPTPPAEQRILDAFATAKFRELYDRATGLISFPRSHGHLTGELAVIPPHRRDDEHVRFFLARNPHYARGTELACLARISPDNLNPFGRRLFLSAMRP
jgi:hypothetical protein